MDALTFAVGVMLGAAAVGAVMFRLLRHDQRRLQECHAMIDYYSERLKEFDPPKPCPHGIENFLLCSYCNSD